MTNADYDYNVAIIDYGVGNLFSISRACETVGLKPVITSSKETIHKSRAIILPGVGAFENAMKSLQSLQLIEVIKDVSKSGKPLLAICLGMQLLMTESFEHGEHKGLDILEGQVIALDQHEYKDPILKFPNIGWNPIHIADSSQSKENITKSASTWSHSPLDNTIDGEHMYFIHSYVAIPTESEIISSTSFCGDISFCASVTRRNIFGCQFHPEKSGKSGLKIYKNLANTIV